MNEVNKLIFDTLTNDLSFNSVMQKRVYPLFAPENTAFPFAVYSIPGGVTSGTKDGRMFTVGVSLFFAANKYTECCAFTDTVQEIMDGGDFDFQTINVEYVDEFNAVVSTLIFSILK